MEINKRSRNLTLIAANVLRGSERSARAGELLMMEDSWRSEGKTGINGQISVEELDVEDRGWGGVG